MNVLLTSPIDTEALALLREHATVDMLETDTKEKVLENIGEADIFFVKSAGVMVDKEVIDRGKNLKLIARYGAGYDNVDVAYATQKGIPVTCTIGSNSRSLAEYTFALLLAIARRLFETAEAAKRGDPDWTKYKGMELLEKTIGIIGAGHIGKEVAKIALAFGMKVLAYDPYVSEEDLSVLNLKRVDLDILLKESDIVTVHAALTEETYGLIGAAELAKMKQTTILLNVARGGMVDEKALFVALSKKKIAAAGIDVVVDDPVKPDNPLLTLKNALVMAHMGSKTHETQKRSGMWAIEDIIRLIRGEKPKRLVNPEVYDTADQNKKLSKDLLVMNPADNVAVCLREVASGEEIGVQLEYDTQNLTVLNPIPIGHKVSLTEIQEGMPIVKYGEVIGKAMSDIRAGHHVHVHNVSDD